VAQLADSSVVLETLYANHGNMYILGLGFLKDTKSFFYHIFLFQLSQLCFALVDDLN
jgi:hypothetical protein